MKPLLLIPTLALMYSALLASNVGYVLNAFWKVTDEKDEKGALLLLQQTRSMTDHAFFPDAGPADKDTLAIRILMVTRSFVSWDESSISSSIGDPEIGRWIRADSGSETTMREMLSNRSPVARWIAIEKLRRATAVSPTVVAALRVVAERDDFLEVRSWMPGDDTESYQSKKPEAEGRVFVANLRNGARELLARMGVALEPIDERQLGREGVVWLARLYMDPGNSDNARWEIVGVLRGVSPRTPEIAWARIQAWATEEPAKLRTLFHNLAKGEFPSSTDLGAASNLEQNGVASRSAPATRTNKSIVSSRVETVAETRAWFPWLVGAAMAAAALLIAGLCYRKR